MQTAYMTKTFTLKNEKFRRYSSRVIKCLLIVTVTLRYQVLVAPAVLVTHLSSLYSIWGYFSLSSIVCFQSHDQHLSHHVIHSYAFTTVLPLTMPCAWQRWQCGPPTTIRNPAGLAVAK